MGGTSCTGTRNLLTRPVDPAAGCEGCPADTLPVRVEDGGRQLTPGELLLRPFQQRLRQLRHVVRPDLARHPEPEPATPLQVRLDVAQVARRRLQGPLREAAVAPRCARKRGVGNLAGAPPPP